MTDNELLSAYVLRPAYQSRTPIIAYAIVVGDSIVRLHKLSGEAIKTMSISDLYVFALNNDLSVEAPITCRQVPYTDDDREAYRRLLKADEEKRKAEIEYCMARLKKLLNF